MCLLNLEKSPKPTKKISISKRTPLCTKRKKNQSTTFSSSKSSQYPQVSLLYTQIISKSKSMKINVKQIKAFHFFIIQFSIKLVHSKEKREIKQCSGIKR